LIPEVAKSGDFPYRPVWSFLVTGIFQMDTDSLVTRVCKLRSDFELVRERVRHWSRAEKLVMGAKPTGRGRPRDFNQRCVLEVALLNELADLGIPIIAWGTTDATVEIIKAGEQWAAGDRRQRWLQIVFPSASSQPKTTIRFKERGRQHRIPLRPRVIVFPHVNQLKPVWLSDVMTTVIVDLTALLRRVQWSQKDEDADRGQWQKVEAANRRRGK
jgi:hypothetical protein